MLTLPRVNLYAHGTQWTVCHGHVAFRGAYACAVLSVMYLMIQKLRGLDQMDGNLWKWSFAALNIGMVDMVGALLVSGFAQAFVERAIGGSTHEAFLMAQTNPWFVESMIARFTFGIMFAAGYVTVLEICSPSAGVSLRSRLRRPPNE